MVAGTEDHVGHENHNTQINDEWAYCTIRTLSQTVEQWLTSFTFDGKFMLEATVIARSRRMVERSVSRKSRRLHSHRTVNTNLVFCNTRTITAREEADTYKSAKTQVDNDFGLVAFTLNFLIPK